MGRCLALLIVSFSLFSGVNAVAAPAPMATADGPLPPSIALILEKAAQRDAAEGTSHYLDTAVVLSIDAHPDYAGVILRRAASLAPNRAGPLAGMAVETFPEVDFDAPPPAPVEEAPEAEADPGPPPKPTGFFSFSGWSGSVELGGTTNSGNTSEQAVTAAFALLNDRQKWRHKVEADFSFTRTDGTTTKQDLHAGYQLDYKFSERLYAFGNLEYEDERFSGFDYRTTETLGIGYRLFQGETWFLDVEGGLSLRQSKVTLTGLMDNEFGGRAKTIFHWDISDTFALDNEASALVTGDRTTLENTISVQTKITDTISGKVSFNIKNDSNVPPGTKKTDTQTKATILYSF